MSASEDQSETIDEMIAELVANSVELAKATHENAQMLAELLAERAKGAASSARPPATETADGGPLAADVLEIATLNAEAAGVSVDDHMRAALLVYAACADPGADDAGEDLHARVKRAVRTAARIQAENQAVKAQSEQAIARNAKVRANRRQRTGDGTP